MTSSSRGSWQKKDALDGGNSRGKARGDMFRGSHVTERMFLEKQWVMRLERSSQATMSRTWDVLPRNLGVVL